MTQRSPFLVALFSPPSLAMLALSAASGLCAAWWMAPVGFFFWLIIFIVAVRDPSLRMSNTVAGRETLSYRFQAKFDRVEKVQTSLFRELASAPAKTKRMLDPVQDAVNDLVDQTYQLCLRFVKVENYLNVQYAKKDIAGEIFVIETKRANTEDAHLHEEYDEALQSLRAQDENAKRMSKLLERFETQLLTLTSTLENILASTIRLQTQEPIIVKAEVPEMLKKLKKQSAELAGFEKETE